MEIIEPGKENQSPNVPVIAPVLKFQDENSMPTSPRTTEINLTRKLSKTATEIQNCKLVKQRWRRMSRGEGLLGAFDPNHRKSTMRGSFMKMDRSGSLLETKIDVKLANNYKLSPSARPKLVQAGEMTSDVLKMTLDDERYHHVDSKQLQLGITNEIKSRLKEMQLVPSCYKIIVHSILGQRYVTDEKSGIKSQNEIKNASRTLDMTEFDTHYSRSYKSSTMFCIVTVYMITID